MGASNPAGELCEWVADRQRQLRWAEGGWIAVAVATGVLALVIEALLYLPLAPALTGVAWLTVAWLTERARRARSRLAGHPLVRAEAPWSLAARRPLPRGWYEAPVTGTVHRTSDAWIWCPSRLVAADLPTLRWPSHEVAAITLSQLWGPLLPPRAQLRLHLRGGATVELIVHDPEQLTVFLDLDDVVTA